jgi:hypothetical protein
MIPAVQRHGYGVGRPLTPKLGEGVLDERVERSGRVPGFFSRPAYEQGKRIEFEISLPLIKSSNAIRTEVAWAAKR